MARRKGPSKAEKRRQAAEGLDKEGFLGFVGGINPLHQEMRDAGMAHAGAWKQADLIGVHGEAAKFWLRLDRMEDTKRTDFLRAFDQYREWADWVTAQPDLFEVHAEAEPAGEPEEREYRDPEPSEPRPPAPEPTETVSAERETEPEDDTGTAAANPELAVAGYTFEAGKQAAIEGRGPDTNPHPETSPSHPIWARGHAQGMRGREAGDEDEEEATSVVPLSGRSSRRRSSASATTH